MPIYPNIDMQSEGAAGPYEGIPQLLALWKEFNPVDLAPLAMTSIGMKGDQGFVPTDRRKYRGEETQSNAPDKVAARPTQKAVKNREELAMQRTGIGDEQGKEAWKTVTRQADPESIVNLVAKGMGVSPEEIRKRMPGDLSSFKFPEVEAGPDPGRASFFEWVYRLAEGVKLAQGGGTDPKAMLGKQHTGSFSRPMEMTGGLGDIDNMIRSGASYEQMKAAFPKITPELYKSLSEYLDLKNVGR